MAMVDGMEFAAALVPDSAAVARANARSIAEILKDRILKNRVIG
jgi:hypothetical protein